MDLSPYVEGVRRELAATAEAAGPDARAVAERLTVSLESALRLALLEVLSAAAGEVTRELAPGSVELRLRGREPSFVVTTPATRPAEPDPAPLVSPEGATARINFRLGEHLKSRIEDAAGEAGLSVNAWLGRAATAALESGERRPQRRVGQRFTGWVR